MAEMMDYSLTPKIFQTDPVHLKSMVNKMVEVETSKEPNTIIKGILFTIDPVSETLVLINDEGESLKMDLVMSFNVKNIKCIESTSVPRIPENLFKENWSKYLSESEVETKRQKLKKWLEENSVPIVECEKQLKLDDILTIDPPYGPEQVMSNNEIVLDRIQNLVKSMPA